MAFRTWAFDEGINLSTQMIDRRLGGPPRCCSRDFVAADMLVHFGAVSTPALAQLRTRFPHLARVGPNDLYLCDACRSTLIRERVIDTRDAPHDGRRKGGVNVQP